MPTCQIWLQVMEGSLIHLRYLRRSKIHFLPPKIIWNLDLLYRHCPHSISYKLYRFHWMTFILDHDDNFLSNSFYLCIYFVFEIRLPSFDKLLYNGHKQNIRRQWLEKSFFCLSLISLSFLLLLFYLRHGCGRKAENDNNA